MAKTVPNFGSIFAATSLGYKWAAEYRLFVKIKRAGAFFKVQIEPPSFMLGERSNLIFDVADAWMTQEGILGFLPILNKYIGRTKSHIFYMDEDGNELPPPVEEKAAPVARVTEESSKKPEEVPAALTGE